MHSWVGKRSPAHCSSMGKALLAGLDAQDYLDRYPDHDLPRQHAATITARAELEKCLADVRARGYAEDREELEPHLYCVAAPVFGRDGTVVASVSVSGPASRLREPSAVATAAAEVRATARLISAHRRSAEVPGWERWRMSARAPRPPRASAEQPFFSATQWFTHSPSPST